MNPADYYGPNGLKVDFSGGPAGAQTVMLQNNATTAGNGTEFAPSTETRH
ncbi:hypothetical protein [Paenibacillus sp. FSL K6-2524]